MTNTGILIITIGIIIVTIIICITNFLCNYYNDLKDERIKDARKAVIAFEKAHIEYLPSIDNSPRQNISISEQDILDFINELKTIL